MRAVITGPGKIELADGISHTPGPGDLVIRPDAVGICGTDIELLEGTMAYLTSGFASYPLVPGHEWTGVVTQVGGAVTGFAVGDRVVGECTVGCRACYQCRTGSYHLCQRRTETGVARRDGALTMQLIFPSHAAHCIPGGIAAADAALVEPSAVAYRGLVRCGVDPGDLLAIVGAGTIGLLCGLIARSQGVDDVTVIEVDPSRREFAQSMGFAVGAPDLTRSCPHVIEASGAPAGVSTALRACSDGGNVVLLGLTGAASIPLDVDGLVVRDLAVHGSLGSPGVWPAVIDLLATGRIRPSSLISHEFPLADIGAAFDLARGRESGVRKVMVRPTPEVEHA
jgi:L-iditol 2-dehydrogenase